MAPENPQQDPQSEVAPKQELTGDQLRSMIEGELRTVIDRYVDSGIEYEKQFQLLRIEKCAKYIAGLQFLTMDDSAGYYGWASVSSTTSEFDDENDNGMLDYNLDIIDSYRRKHVSTLGLRPFWNAAAVPDDPQSEIDRKAARNAGIAAVWMRNKWNVRIKNIEIADRHYAAGTVFIHNPFIADKNIFGEIEEPILETQVQEQEQPPDPLTGIAPPPLQTEVVVENGKKKYAGTGPACNIYDGSMVTIPFTCRDFKRRPWLLLDKEEDRGELLQMYGDTLRDKMNETGEISSTGTDGMQEQGKRTRAQMASLTGTYTPGNETTWTHSRYWLSTTCYEYFKDKDTRDALYEYFPKGMMVAYVEDNLMRIKDADPDVEWGCIQSSPGPTVMQDPLCWPILGNQDIVNFLANISVAREERGLPTAICDAELVDVDEINKQRYRPSTLIKSKAGWNRSLGEAIYPLPTPNKDDGAGAALHNLVISNTESRLGLLKAIWGAGSDQRTASGQRMELQQGLMQLGVPGEYISYGWADAYMRGCKALMENAPKGFVVADEAGATSDILDLDAMRAGKFHFQVDPGLPMTRAEMAQILDGIIKENPEFAMAAGLTSPLAAPIVRDLILPGMPQIPSPLADARNKVIKRIQMLLQQAPTPGAPDPVTGEPGPMQPSVMPEQYVDDPGQHAEITREWLNSDAGQKINPNLGADPKHQAGYQNVVAYGLFCSEQAAPPPPPPAPPKPLSVSVKAPELLIPGVPEVLNASFGLGIPPAPEPPPTQPGMPGMEGQPPGGPGGPQPAAPSTGGAPPTPKPEGNKPAAPQAGMPAGGGGMIQ